MENKKKPVTKARFQLILFKPIGKDESICDLPLLYEINVSN